MDFELYSNIKGEEQLKYQTEMQLNICNSDMHVKTNTKYFLTPFC